MQIDGRGCGSGDDGRSSLAGRLCLLVFLLLLAKAAFSWEIHCPLHAVLTPMVCVLANSLAFLVAVLVRNLLARLVLFLPSFVEGIFLVLPLTTFLAHALALFFIL